MKLPANIDLRERFKYTVHHTGKTIECVSFTNGQQSVILTAFENAERNDANAFTPQSAMAIRDAFVNLCNQCILTPEVDVSTWPDYEIDALFIKLRIKSLDSKSDRILICKKYHESTESYCDTRIKVTFDLEKVTIESDDTINPLVDLGGGYTLHLKQPAMYSVTIDQLDEELDNISLFLDKLVYEDKENESTIEYDFLTQSKEDIQLFIEHAIVPKIKVHIINQFLSKLPHIHLETNVTCPECGQHHKLIANSLKDVFN